MIAGLLLIMAVTIVPFFNGAWVVCLKKKRETVSVTEVYMSGILFLFFISELAACVVIKTQSSFSVFEKTVEAAGIITAFSSAVINRKLLKEVWARAAERVKNEFAGKKEKFFPVVMGVTILLLLAQIWSCFIYVPDTGSDVTTETVSVTDSTETVFSYDPVTGEKLERGMYPIYKFASLPLLYTALYRLGGLSLTVYLYYGIPVWVIVSAFAIMAQWGRNLFGEERNRRWYFLLFYGLLVVTGDGMTGNYGYRLLHEGFKGETVAYALVIPFGGWLIMEMLVQKEWLYGIAGTGLAITGVIFTRPLFWPEISLFAFRDGGRQWGMLLLGVAVFFLVKEILRKKWKKREIYFLLSLSVLGMVRGSIFPTLGISYVAVCLEGVAEERGRKLACLWGMAALICLCGTVVPFGAETVKKKYVPAWEEEIQDNIAKLAENYEGGALLLAPDQVMEQARMRCANVRLPYGKDLWHEKCNREIADIYEDDELLLHEQMQTDYAQPDTIAAMAWEKKCDILVLREAMSPEAKKQYGWKDGWETTGYALYFRERNSSQRVSPD